MKTKLREWLCKFLGIDDIVKGLRNHSNRLSAFEGLTNMGIDVSMKPGTNTQIIIVSHLGEGMVRVIDMRIDSRRELIAFVKMLKNSYQPYRIEWDGPMGFGTEMRRQMNED